VALDLNGDRNGPFILLTIGHCFTPSKRLDPTISILEGPNNDTGFKKQLIAVRPSWIVVGEGIEEYRLTVLVGLARQMNPRARVAALGAADDLERCDRWLRRGCEVYLNSSTSVERLITVLQLASLAAVVAFDREYQTLSNLRRGEIRAGLTTSRFITKREHEVLSLLKAGLRNAEIGSVLHIGEGTVEYHVTNLLGKLGASNRTEAAGRASLIDV